MRANNSISTLPIANMAQQHFTQAQVAHNRLLTAQIANLKDVTRKFKQPCILLGAKSRIYWFTCQWFSCTRFLIPRSFLFAQELIGKFELSPCKRSKPSWTRQHRTQTCPQKKNKPYCTTFSPFCSRHWRPSLLICGKLSHARQLLLSFTLLRFTHLNFLFTPPSFSAAKTACSSYSTMPRDWFQTWLTKESCRYLTPST